MMAKTIRIGGAAGFWGDSLEGAGQLVMRGEIDFLVFDYLAEVTMSLLARVRARKAELGYVPDFVEMVAPLLPEIRRRGIRVVSNAGGVNPVACAAALAKRAEAVGVPLKIAVVTGDDVMAQIDTIRAADAREMFSGAALPERLLSANAYFGAQPIAAALDRGADVVITGRCVDSAVTLGALVHAFGWSWSDYDKLAQASLAGHLIECSAQVTGGLFTDWRDVPGWDDMGLPIADCAADGTFTITKAEGTGGLVSPLSVGEQMLYEIGDPVAYVLPDVVCDFRAVTIVADGANRVSVSGARGRPPTAELKVSATWHDGFRTIGTVTIAGRDAGPKAQHAGEAILARVRRLLAERGLGDFTETSLEVLGTEAVYGAAAQSSAAREVVLKIGARHASEKALEILAREIAPAASSMAQGLTGFFAGRPAVQPVMRLFSFLWPKASLTPRVAICGGEFEVPFAASARLSPSADEPYQSAPAEVADASAPLIALAVGRSGDKGNTANIGILARRTEYMPWLRAALTPEAVAAFFAQTGVTRVDRYDLPGMNALNFVLHDALGGGGVASLRIDPQGKAFAQMLMDFPIAIPRTLADQLMMATR
ncbi:acyclic terpene utilization AtuA family protein [Bradyrhizobium sp. LHD-71]|uniref:acyclic terpene utilization AtuA family protein n=1 Tax=Bradyrhizobium sp. LHD-71 TaxID=3072141 RepID=UPI00280DFD74|nr:acyclic terpene utilization AtuA family protein [Bradyrhizobium sp. LHD-71]MDQ8727486.1 acyclic terpene utilization AtuA family protein [Bradyrhizobium sp. LHD-71]